MKTIHKLLLILKDEITNNNHVGLCSSAFILWNKDKITLDQSYKLENYIFTHRPIRRPISCTKKDWLNNYYWTRFDKLPRLRWLNKHIKLTSCK